MFSEQSIDPQLTPQDRLLLQTLLGASKASLHTINDTSGRSEFSEVNDSGYASSDSLGGDEAPIDDLSASVETCSVNQHEEALCSEHMAIEQLAALSDPKSAEFEPTVFVMWDLRDIRVPQAVRRYLLQPYIEWGRSVVRNETDVVMLTHLIIYATTSLPSALYLFYNFYWWHGILHFVMQSYYVGTYTLMMHQHIHMRGILATKYKWLDTIFPYITDPLHGHTWNSYYFHHVKHHHVEGNGPNDLSSTLRYQRDSPFDFAIYVGRFLLLIWFELPLYFIGKRKFGMALKMMASEFSEYAVLYALATRVNFGATLCAFLLPLCTLRLGLMIGNWGQHALVDEIEPDSDFRSSITLVDVASNRFCYNDGYHTSHHLNPRRHWREHPASFLKQKEVYAREGALVFHNIDYLMMTYRILRKDYMHLAKCLVPIGEQVGMTEPQLADMLSRKTRKFTEEEIRNKFGKAA